MKVNEIKRHLDGRIERFACDLAARWPNLVVLRYDHEEARQAGALLLPAGSRTYGFFWRGRAYSLYRIEKPGGRVIAHRFDVVEDVHFEDTSVSYRDLLLDVWIDPDGRVRVEDEDEVVAYARRGLLDAAQRRRIERTRALLLRRHAAIAREAGRILREATV